MRTIWNHARYKNDLWRRAVGQASGNSRFGASTIRNPPRFRTRAHSRRSPLGSRTCSSENNKSAPSKEASSNSSGGHSRATNAIERESSFHFARASRTAYEERSIPVYEIFCPSRERISAVPHPTSRILRGYSPFSRM